MKPNSKGEVKASDNVLKMFKTDKGRILVGKQVHVFTSRMINYLHLSWYVALKLIA